MAFTPDVPFLTVRQRFWRVLSPRWAHRPLDGDGAARHGGRWNARGMPALYLSAELTTAVAEYEQDIGIRPGTFCAYDVDVERVADLRSAEASRALGVDPAARFVAWKSILLLEHGEPPGWKIASALIDRGASGALVPSVRWSMGTNLVLWRWYDGPGSMVIALDPQTDLPRDQSSWR